MENTDTAAKDKLPQRIGVVGIVLEDPASCSQNVNRLLSRYALLSKDGWVCRSGSIISR